MAAQKRGLGRGLDALFSDVSVDLPEGKTIEIEEEKTEIVETKEGLIYLDINDIKPNENQPRQRFDESKLQELADSIIEHGIIQPVVVRKKEVGYEIVAGERRWRASRKAGLKKIPCVVRELSDEQNMLIAIIENMQREDLNPIEEAEGLSRMAEVYGLTQEQISKGVGKSRPYITNSLRLLKLPEEIREMTKDGKLSAGHARALISVKDKSEQIKLAEKAINENLSVREIENILKSNTDTKKAKVKNNTKDAEVVRVEEELKISLGTKVNIIQKRNKKGKIEIEFYSKDELNRLIELLRQ